MQTFDLTRKDLPAFGVLTDLNFNVEEIISHCQNQNILNPATYTDIQVSAQSNHENFVRLNSFHKNRYFIADGEAPLEGEKYRQLYLTNIRSEFNDAIITPDFNDSPKKRFSRLDRNSPNYNPIVDELNYTLRNKLVFGIFEQILDSFSDQVTRVRLAYLAPKFSIKPHIDHDPSYIVRYHIPIITNRECSMNIKRKTDTASTHFPADGRAYFLNAGLLHWASNESDHWRLHLIVDVHGQKNLKKLQEFS